MTNSLNSRGVAQIFIGAGCLAGAWYFGHLSSAQTEPDPATARPELRSEDLVWNEAGPVAPPLKDIPGEGIASPAGSGSEFAERPMPPTGQGPMIVEPDFSPLVDRMATAGSGGFSSVPQPGDGEGKSGTIAGQETADWPGSAPDRLAKQVGSAGLVPLDEMPPGFSPLADERTRPENGAPVGVGGRFQTLRPPVDPVENSILQRPSVAGQEPAVGDWQPIAPRTAESTALGADGFRVHVVRPGETLQSLSRHYFGSPDYYLDIYSVNQDVLQSPGSIRTGQSLKIPQPAR